MKDINKIVKLAISSLLVLGTTTGLVNQAASATVDQQEKCYGIAKTAANDCQTATQSCAGSADKDRQADAFLLVPKGLCTRISGGSLKSGNNAT